MAPLAPVGDGYDEEVAHVAPRCDVNFKWVETRRHANGTADARIDVGGSGVTQGWAVELDFAAAGLPVGVCRLWANPVVRRR